MSKVLEQLKDLMKSLGETDYSLQHKAHISQSTIYRIVEGKTSDPGVHKVDGLARAMGHRLSLVPMSEFSSKLQNVDDIRSLTKVITMIETLASARGFQLTPLEKAELILANYKNSSTETQQENLLKVVNSKS